MSHFLNKAESCYGTRLGKPWAAIRVKVVKKRPATLQLDPKPGEPIIILADFTMIAPLPERVVLLDPEGGVIAHDTATGRYHVSLDTFDPFHAVLDLR